MLQFAVAVRKSLEVTRELHEVRSHPSNIRYSQLAGWWPPYAHHQLSSCGVGPVCIQSKGDNGRITYEHNKATVVQGPTIRLPLEWELYPMMKGGRSL